MTRAIVTSAYRYKRPPRKRKAVALAVPAIVAIDPQTRVAKKGRRQTEGFETAAKAEKSPPRFGSAAAQQSTTKRPQPANDDGGRADTDNAGAGLSVSDRHRARPQDGAAPARAAADGEADAAK